jgi:hypothetical protein
VSVIIARAVTLHAGGEDSGCCRQTGSDRELTYGGLVMGSRLMWIDRRNSWITGDRKLNATRALAGARVGLCISSGE